MTKMAILNVKMLNFLFHIVNIRYSFLKMGRRHRLFKQKILVATGIRTQTIGVEVEVADH